MTNRVLLGNKGGTYGLWVSKPGVDVETADESGMMLSVAQKSLQIVASGVLTGTPLGQSGQQLTIPDLGFKPFLLIACPWYDVYWRFLSNTTVQFYTVPWSGSGSPQDLVTRGFASGSANTDIYWAVTNFPCGQ